MTFKVSIGLDGTPLNPKIGARRVAHILRDLAEKLEREGLEGQGHKPDKPEVRTGVWLLKSKDNKDTVGYVDCEYREDIKGGKTTKSPKRPAVASASGILGSENQSMFRIAHTTPQRALRHLRKLDSEGAALLSKDEIPWLEWNKWDIRVWQYLKKLLADPTAYDGALRLDPKDLAGISFFGPPASAEERDKRARKTISRRLVMLASVIEKLEGEAGE